MTRRITARAGSGSTTKSPAPVRPAGSGDRGPSERPGGDQAGGLGPQGEGTPRPATRCPTCGHWSLPRAPACARCGHSWTSHNIHNKQRTACSLSSCGCHQYQEDSP